MAHLPRFKMLKRFLLPLLGLTTFILTFYCLYFFENLVDQWQLYQLAHMKSTHNGVPQPMTFPARLKGKKLNFDQVFEARKVSFDGYNYTTGTKNKEGKPKLILLATPWNGVWTTINYYALRPDDASFTLYGCPNTNCRVTSDMTRIKEANALLFHLLDLPNTFPEHRTANQIWISYILEAPWRLVANNVKLTSLNGIFNWTMSYRKDSDILLKYGFIGKKNSDVPDKVNPTPFSRRKSVVWFVSDCNVPSNRGGYVRELSKYIDVDIYGLCGTKTCFPSQSSVCYEGVLQSYKFYLSFENSICKDYVTEKYFNVLEYDIIPLVFGGADYEKIGPPGGYIDVTKYPQPKELADKLRNIGEDETEYSTYFEWKSSYQSFLHPWMCYLCDKLHGPIVPSVKRDLAKWWMDDAQCKTWVKDKGFVPLPTETYTTEEKIKERATDV